MSTFRISRRQFGEAAAGGLAAGAQESGLTARQVIERIQKNIGVEWRSQTVDTFKVGNPEARVTGIATTFMSTLDVLERAAKAGKNLIVTHEPTFYSHLDQTTPLAEDPVYKHKMAFIEKSGLVIWRFHDHWHMRKPDAISASLAQVLEWEKYKTGEGNRLFTLPETTLENMAQDVQRKLKGRTVRAVGDPRARVSKVILSPGSPPPLAAMRAQAGYDVYVSGETTEWEGGAYAQDMVTAGLRKGMILLGHEVSEEPGMKACAEWLKTIIREVPVEWIPSGEPFWRPA